MPRPEKKPEDRKSHHLRVPVNEAQKELIEQACSLEDQDFAAWARAILLDAAKRAIGKHARQEGSATT